MKLNWGTAIFFVILAFFLAVIAFFIFINNLDINLVEDNYYEKELVYQDRINKIDNLADLTGKITVFQETDGLIVQFPSHDSTLAPAGSLLFYRPSDPKKDFSIPLQLDDSLSQAVDISTIDPGRWIIKIEWEMGGKEYYFEEGIIIH